MSSPYEILEVSRGATADEIRVAYKRAAMKHHPDRGGSLDKFLEIKRAYKALQKCPECGGTGSVTKKHGAFVKKERCTTCWNP